VNTENPVVNDSGQAEVVEDLATVSPDVGRSELLKALVVKSINLGNLSRFVVASNKGDSIWVSDL